MSQEPCQSCAFTPGSEANQEPHNYLKGLLCTWGPRPFWCHDAIDWRVQRPDSERVAEIRSGQAHICRGWQREVQRLHALGFYKTYRLARAGLVYNALQALMIVNGSNYDDEEKKIAKEELWGYVKRLCVLETKRKQMAITS